MNQHSPAVTYSTHQIATACAVTLRQLQWWDERRVIQPRHEGHRRLYDERDLRMIALLAELRRLGISLQRIRAILRRLQPDMEHHIEEHHIVVMRVPEIASDRITYWFASEFSGIMSAARQAAGPVFLLNLAHIFYQAEERMLKRKAHEAREKARRAAWS